MRNKPIPGVTRRVTFTPEFVEREYNNRAAVADHPLWLRQWAELSLAAREQYRPQLDVRYGPAPKETLDLFVPDDKAQGTLVFIHGGYWRALDKIDHSFVAAPFVEEGIAVAVVNYDLCPDVSIVAIADECRRALLWVSAHGARHGAHAANVVVAGHSAGGHLAAMMFATDWRAQGLAHEPFIGGVTLSGVHDLAPLVHFSFNVDFRLDDALAAQLSPINHGSHTKAPLLAAVGGAETSEFLRQTQLIWDAWPQNRPPGSRGPLVVPDKHHFSVVVDYANPESELTRATLALFR